MSILIPVFNSILNQEVTQLVDARILHQFLEVTSRFNDWITNRVKEYEFIENQDFIIFTKNLVKMQRGRPTAEYHITLDMAKELSMVEKNEKGRLARRYFIECEKRAYSNPMLITDRRFLLSLDGQLKLAIQPLANDVAIFSPGNKSQMIDIISQAVPIEILPDLLKVGIDRLGH